MTDLNPVWTENNLTAAEAAAFRLIAALPPEKLAHIAQFLDDRQHMLLVAALGNSHRAAEYARRLISELRVLGLYGFDGHEPEESVLYEFIDSAGVKHHVSDIQRQQLRGEGLVFRRLTDQEIVRGVEQVRILTPGESPVKLLGVSPMPRSKRIILAAEDWAGPWVLEISTTVFEIHFPDRDVRFAHSWMMWGSDIEIWTIEGRQPTRSLVLAAIRKHGSSLLSVDAPLTHAPRSGEDPTDN